MSSLYFLYFGAIGLLQPHLYVFLRQGGIGESWLGVVFGIGPLAVLLTLPFWGSLSDLTGRADRVVQLTAMLAGISGLAVFYRHSLNWILVLIPFFYAVEYAIEPMINAAVLTRDESTDRPGGFGRRRLWGSLGFVVGAGIGGLLIYLSGWGAVFLGFLATMVLLAVRVNQVDEFRSASLPVEQYLTSLGNVVQSRRLQILLLYLVLWSIPFSGNFMAFSWYWEEAGGSSLGLGLAWGMGAILEVPLYWLSVRYWKSLWLKGLLLLSPGVAALRWGLYLLFPEPGLLVGIQLLHGLMFVSFSVGSVYLVDIIAESTVRNTGQGLLGASVFGLGAALGNLITGYVYETFGSVIYYGSMMAIDFLAVLVMLLLISIASTNGVSPDTS